MFSGFYLALLLILALPDRARALVRMARARRRRPGWRAFWAWMNTIGSIGAPLLWGIALASLLHGVPIDSDQGYAGDFGDLFSVYTVLAGIAVCLLFALHGAVFLTLRTLGELRGRAQRAAVAPRTGRSASSEPHFLVWTLVVAGDVKRQGAVPGDRPRRPRRDRRRRSRRARGGRRERSASPPPRPRSAPPSPPSSSSLYPRVMVSDPDFGNSLTIENASSA